MTEKKSKAAPHSPSQRIPRPTLELEASEPASIIQRDDGRSLKGFWEELRSWHPGLTFILGLITGVAAILAYTSNQVDSRVSAKLESESFREELASLVRPSLIFDMRGHIVKDAGADAYIEDWQVNVDTVKLGSPQAIGMPDEYELTIDVRTSRAFEHPPLVEPLTTKHRVFIEGMPGNRWRIYVVPFFDVVGTGPYNRRFLEMDNQPKNFRLEFVR